MKKTLPFAVLLGSFSLLGSSVQAAPWRVQQIDRNGESEVLSIQKLDGDLSGPRLDATVVKRVRSLPFFLWEDAPPSADRFEEFLVSDTSAFTPKQRLFYQTQKEKIEGTRLPTGTEVRTLIERGPAANRINLTMLGDGYLADEKEKFFTDARRLTDDLFQGNTFASYLPLFNVYAVFVPSHDSGITDVTQKNTAFGLYRNPVGSKRGIMPGNTAVLEQAIRLAPATDYPIVIANDDFYGGLGGRYAITTRSVESGSMVLRHELGHNFGEVGEEYDGGYAYMGANFSRSSDLSWKNWLTSSQRINDSVYLDGQYVWQPLNQGPYRASFDFPETTSLGNYSFELMISAVGWEDPAEVSIFLDGQKTPYEGVFTADRSFFNLVLDRSLKPGRHRLEIREERSDGNNVLAFAVALAHSPDYDYEPGHVAGFATFDDAGKKVGFRPTHEDCLMRNMRSRDFCAPDRENFWHHFLNKVNLIDRVEVVEAVNDSGAPTRKVTLKTPPLNDLEIKWFKLAADGKETEIARLANQVEWDAASLTAGKYRVKVDFKTPEVRTFDSRFQAKSDFKL